MRVLSIWTGLFITKLHVMKIEFTVDKEPKMYFTVEQKKLSNLIKVSCIHPIFEKTFDRQSYARHLTFEALIEHGRKTDKPFFDAMLRTYKKKVPQ
jgi:hypothetical protein